MKNQYSIRGVLKYDRRRGVVYFFPDEASATCVLRVEGIPQVKIGHMIDIHLFGPNGSHHHGFCDAICAEKIKKGKP